MNLEAFEITNKETLSQIDGGIAIFPVVFMLSAVITVLPVLVNIWFRESGSLQLKFDKITFEYKWDNRLSESAKTMNECKKEIQELKTILSKNMPSFYVF